MIIIFGAGEEGISIRNNYYGDNSDVVFYDNDRRKWGKVIYNTPVVDFDYFCQMVKKSGQ